MVNKSYSFAKGTSKGIKYALVFGLSLILTILGSQYKEILDKPLIDVIAPYLQQLLGTMTLGGLITMAINYLKVSSQK